MVPDDSKCTPIWLHLLKVPWPPNSATLGTFDPHYSGTLNVTELKILGIMSEIKTKGEDRKAPNLGLGFVAFSLFVEYQ